MGPLTVVGAGADPEFGKWGAVGTSHSYDRDGCAPLPSLYLPTHMLGEEGNHPEGASGDFLKFSERLSKLPSCLRSKACSLPSSYASLLQLLLFFLLSQQWDASELLLPAPARLYGDWTYLGSTAAAMRGTGFPHTAWSPQEQAWEAAVAAPVTALSELSPRTAQLK